MLKNWVFWLGVLLTPLFLLLFFRGTSLSEILKALRGINYILIIPGLAFYFIGVWFRTIRWRYLLLPLRSIPPPRLLPPVIMSFALNNILPGRVGFLARAYFLGEREKVSKVASGATIVADQVFDGLALLFLALVISLFIPLAPWARKIILLALVLYGGFVLLLYITAISPQRAQRWSQPLLRLSPSLLKEKVERWIELSLSGLVSLHSPQRLFLILLCSLLVWLFEAGMFYFIALSLNLHLPFYAFLLATAIANLALAFPSLPGGIGPFEYFGKQTILLFGVKEAVATAYIGFLHLTLVLPVTF